MCWVSVRGSSDLFCNTGISKFTRASTRVYQECEYIIMIESVSPPESSNGVTVGQKY